jgi:hypothetical protein
MYVKVISSGGRRYVRLVEAFRDEHGAVQHRVVANLGRIEAVQGGEANALINGLLRASGQAPLEEGTGAVEFAPALSVGDTWLLTALWKSLGFQDAFRRVLRNAHPGFDAEKLLRVMVFNRLCDPESKLGLLRWLEGTLVPEVAAESVTHQRLLRVMDTVAERAESLGSTLATLLRPLIDETLSLVFYDMTTISVEAGEADADDLRRFGMSKEGVIRPQVMLGVVQTAEGLPLHHEVFAGNTAEAKTLIPVLRQVLARFPIRRVVVVADRGLLSLDNLEELKAITLADGVALEFILAVPGRRYGDFAETLGTFHDSVCVKADREVVGETTWNGCRLVMAHHPAVAMAKTTRRDERIAEIESLAGEWAGKLDGQDAGVKLRGRKLSDAGAGARFYHAVKEAHLGHILRLDMRAATFSYDVDEAALALARINDGKLILVTNVDAKTLNAQQVVERYKALADIERGFRVLKSEIEIAPVFHRLTQRIRAHALICFLALLLYRVIRMRLKAKHSSLSPERALEITRRIQLHQVTLHRRHTTSGLSALTAQQHELFSALDLPIPTQNRLKPVS